MALLHLNDTFSVSSHNSMNALNPTAIYEFMIAYRVHILRGVFMKLVGQGGSLAPRKEVAGLDMGPYEVHRLVYF